MSIEPLYLLTWNLHGRLDADGLAATHLAETATRALFVAAFQELPAEGEFAMARTADSTKLESQRIRVVKCAKSARIAIAHHPNLVQLGAAKLDIDNEFVAAVFRLPSSRKTFGVVAVHAEGIWGPESTAERGAARGMLRHAIGSLRLNCDSLIVLGDFNSHYAQRDISMWHCFNAVSGHTRPTDRPGRAMRRGVPHPALHVVVPTDPTRSTFAQPTGAVNQEPLILDFIAVDETLHERLPTSNVMTEVGGKPVFDASAQRPCVSDHLPVEGHVYL